MEKMRLPDGRSVQPVISEVIKHWPLKRQKSSTISGYASVVVSSDCDFLSETLALLA